MNADCTITVMVTAITVCGHPMPAAYLQQRLPGGVCAAIEAVMLVMVMQSIEGISSCRHRPNISMCSPMHAAGTFRNQGMISGNNIYLLGCLASRLITHDI